MKYMVDSSKRKFSEMKSQYTTVLCFSLIVIGVLHAIFTRIGGQWLSSWNRFGQIVVDVWLRQNLFEYFNNFWILLGITFNIAATPTFYSLFNHFAVDTTFIFFKYICSDDNGNCWISSAYNLHIESNRRTEKNWLKFIFWSSKYLIEW